MIEIVNEQDAFGKFVLDGLSDHSTMYITERSDGYVGICNRDGLYFSKYNDWTDLDKNILKLAKGKMVDVGAGSGRVTKYLQDIGLETTATDISKGCIEACKKIGVKKAKVVGIEKLDKVLPKNYFDTVLLLGHNFGLLPDIKKGRKILRILDNITTDKGIIIGHTMDPSKSQNPIHQKYYRLNTLAGRLPGQIKMRTRYSIYKDPWYDYTFWREEDLRELIKGTNWQIDLIEKEPENSSYYVVLKKRR